MEEPSDEMLSCIMREAAAEADMRWKSAEKKFFEQLQDMILKTTSPTALWPDTDLCWLFFVCTQSPTINAARIAKRVMEGGHDVPISKVISRYNKFIVNCQMLSRLVDRAYIYDNSIDGQEARLLFRFADGIIIKRYTNNPPRWAQIFWFFFLRPQINVKAVLTVINPNGIYRIQQ